MSFSKYFIQAVREGNRAVQLLDRALKREQKKGVFSEDWDALWHARWLVMQDLEERRELISKECAPWFDGSAFKVEAQQEAA